VEKAVDPRFKLTPFDHADRRQRAVEANVREMETMMLSSVASAPTPDRPAAVVAEQPAPSLSLWSKLDMASTQSPASTTTDSRQDILRRERVPVNSYPRQLVPNTNSYPEWYAYQAG